MKREKETRTKLLASGKQEFLEKGYLQASLRSICKNAGVTTGALYFFFQDKEDLFAAIVEEPLTQLMSIMRKHYASEMEQLKSGQVEGEDFSDDMEAAAQVIHYLYSHYEEVQLLLTKAQGSRFEYCIDEFVTITQNHYRVLSDKMSEKLGQPKIEDYFIHWISHLTVDTFVHLISHEKSEEEAVKHMKLTVKYLVNGWYGMFSSK
ncbi:MAG: TetR/AcrR family transcriptional regulator [bacterium]|nr:TetR/AcrR family transcriptional regulator [bacterium]